jgi:hypothetical protein
VRDVIQKQSTIGKDLANFDSQIVEILDQLRMLHFKADQTQLSIKQNELMATVDSK